MASLIGKGRKPKFELHLKIYDLNNVPLVNGHSFIKWHLVHSMHAEHRGRTPKCSIQNHRVDYSFAKHIPSVRISIDKANNLVECPIELEIIQEFGHTERVTLGIVRLNLSEYVEESETMVKDVASPPRRRSSVANISPTSNTGAPDSSTDKMVEEGIVRRYLMQDSKVNSTLRVGILMVQSDGDRSFIAPALRSAPVFGGIAGLVPPEQMEDDMNRTFSKFPTIAKPRDASEVHDLYRRTLAASWYSQRSELPADECIEDIFTGGDGWKTKRSTGYPSSDNDDDDDAEEDRNQNNTLRPGDFRRMSRLSGKLHHNHRRTRSGASDKSVSTVKSQSRGGPTFTTRSSRPRDRRDDSGGSGHSREREREKEKEKEGERERRKEQELARTRADSFVSMAPTLGSDSSGREGYKRVKEVKEADARDDLVAWTLPGSQLVA